MIVPLATAQATIAVLIPCYNEALTIGSVVQNFKAEMPDSVIYVYDNNSTDGTTEVARAAGAMVRRETRQGKGNVIRRMFSDIEADVYLLVDGDDTYDASAAPRLVQCLLSDQLDFVNGARVSDAREAYRRGHRLGNRALSKLVDVFFGRQFTDMLSGYKVFSRRFVKSFPAMSRGFETETELVVHALELRMSCAEMSTAYKRRPLGSVSKLRTLRDGLQITALIIRLIKDERPLLFFGLLGKCSSLVISGMLSFFAALILDVVTRTRQELRRLAYLTVMPRSELGWERRLTPSSPDSNSES